MAIVESNEYIIKLFERYKDNPDCKKEILTEYNRHWKTFQRESRIGIIICVLFSLYGCEFSALKRDICNILLMESSELDSKNRYECLQVIFPHILNLFDGDISEILGALQELNYNDGDDYDVDDLPFT